MIFAIQITPRVFRHTAAVHLLDAGVEVNVIRGWLGHVGLETTNRYAEITVRVKEAGRSRGLRDGSHVHGATSTLGASFQSTLVKRPASTDGARNVFFASSIAASSTV